MMQNEKRLLELKERQERGEYSRCPRCGRDTMKPDLYTNALSRHAGGIYVCDECGTSDALLDFMHNPLPLECWALFRPEPQQNDFTELDSSIVLGIIEEEQIPFLSDLYDRWLNHENGEEFTEYRREAFNHCPGLTEIWESPFQVLYKVADGEVILRFRKKDGQVDVSTFVVVK